MRDFKINNARNVYAFCVAKLPNADIAALARLHWMSRKKLARKKSASKLTSRHKEYAFEDQMPRKCSFSQWITLRCLDIYAKKFPYKTLV
jgi:hypothetical protein